MRRGLKRASSIARRRLAHPTASAGATAPSLGQCRDESRCTVHGIVVSRVHKLCGDDRVKCRADPGHILAINPDPRSGFEYLSHGRALDRLRLGRAQPLAERGLDWLSLADPGGCEWIRGGLGRLGIGEGVSAWGQYIEAY